MKVLFIGCYRDGTGWAKAAGDYILAMDAAGIDVVCRPLKLNDNNMRIHPRLMELEQKSLRGSDICIQNVLPHHMDYNGLFDKNIALYFTETDRFTESTWANKINLMDEAWVSCEQMVQASKTSGVEIPIKVIPCAADINKYLTPRPKLAIPELQEKFCFYFIGDSTRRKNLVALLKAYHLEFETHEQIALVIKTTKYGENPEETLENLKNICNTVKTNLKLYPSLDKYNYELLITEHISEEELCSLHTSCHCFVMPSFGEAWCIPAFDAMGFGSTPICSNIGGPADFLKDAGFLVECTDEPVFGMTDTFSDIYVGRENWWNINVNALRKQMRELYELWKNDGTAYSALQAKGLERVQEYSYEKVGQMIKEELENGN